MDILNSNLVWGQEEGILLDLFLVRLKGELVHYMGDLERLGSVSRDDWIAVQYG